MNYDVFKALHIIAVVTWFAGLFYIVRLFIYHVEALEKQEPERSILVKQFSIMERRLWLGITWPSAIAVLIFGGYMLKNFFPISDHPWLQAKLVFVFLLYMYHYFCGVIYNNLQKNKNKLSSTQLRMWNEVTTLFLVAIVFLVILRDDMPTIGKSLGIMFIIALTLFVSIKIYKRKRAREV